MSNKIQILFVDDLFDSNRDLLIEKLDLFMENIYEIEFAGDLEESLNKINSKTYDILICDILLDGNNIYNNDGQQVIEYASKKSLKTKIFFYSNYNDDDIVNETKNYLDQNKIPYEWLGKKRQNAISERITNRMKEWVNYIYQIEMSYEKQEEFKYKILNSFYQETEIELINGIWTLGTLFFFVNFNSDIAYQEALLILHSFPKISDTAWNHGYDDGEDFKHLRNQLPLKEYYERLYTDKDLSKIIENKINKTSKIRLDDALKLITEDDFKYIHLTQYTEKIGLKLKGGRPVKNKLDGVYKPKDKSEYFTPSVMDIFYERLINRQVFLGLYLFMKITKSECYYIMYSNSKLIGVPHNVELAAKNNSAQLLSVLNIPFLAEENVNDSEERRIIKIDSAFKAIWEALSTDEQRFLKKWFNETLLYMRQKASSNIYYQYFIEKNSFIDRQINTNG